MSSHDEWAAARDAAALDAEQSAKRGELDYLIDMAEHYATKATDLAREQGVCGIAIVDETAAAVSGQLAGVTYVLAAAKRIMRARADVLAGRNPAPRDPLWELGR